MRSAQQIRRLCRAVSLLWSALNQSCAIVLQTYISIWAACTTSEVPLTLPHPAVLGTARPERPQGLETIRQASDPPTVLTAPGASGGRCAAGGALNHSSLPLSPGL